MDFPTMFKDTDVSYYLGCSSDDGEVCWPGSNLRQQRAFNLEQVHGQERFCWVAWRFFSSNAYPYLRS
jgi:hypothetical protein